MNNDLAKDCRSQEAGNRAQRSKDKGLDLLEIEEKLPGLKGIEILFCLETGFLCVALAALAVLELSL